MDERFCYTTDPAIGVPGFYKHAEDGTIDGSVRYKWVDAAPDDPADGSGHFEPHEQQYALVEPPKPTVQLEAVASVASDAQAAPEPAPEPPKKKHFWQ